MGCVPKVEVSATGPRFCSRLLAASLLCASCRDQHAHEMSAARTLIRDQTGVARERSDGHHVLHRGPAFGAGRRSIFSIGSFDGHRHARPLSLGLFITPTLKPTLIRCPGSLSCGVFSAALRSAQTIKHCIARAVGKTGNQSSALSAPPVMASLRISAACARAASHHRWSRRVGCVWLLSCAGEGAHVRVPFINYCVEKPTNYWPNSSALFRAGRRAHRYAQCRS
jgi:hypothetical protein